MMEDGAGNGRGMTAMGTSDSIHGSKGSKDPANAPSNLDAPAHVADLANWLETLPRSAALEFLAALPLERRADTLACLPLQRQAEFAANMARNELVEVVTEMDADDRADFFKELNEAEQQHLMQDLAQEARDDIARLSAHGEGTVGAIMTTDYATLGANMNA